MIRRVALAVVVLVVVLGTPAAVVRVVQRDRIALLQQFASQRLAQVQKAAREIEGDVADIGEDLVFAGQLVYSASSHVDRERELSALLAVVRRYHMAFVFDSAGNRELEVVDPASGSVVATPELATEIRSVARRALVEKPGQVEISPPVSVADGRWYRVFATAFPARSKGVLAGSIVLAVDGASFIADLKLLAEYPGTRQIMLGAQGQPTPATDADLEKEIRRISEFSGRSKGLERLLQHMRDGVSGTIRMDKKEATQLGLGNAIVVAAYSPVWIAGGRHWAIATVSSASTLDRQERAIAVRVGVISGAIAICLLAFAVYIVMGSRQAIAMRERLRHAEELAHAHEKAEKVLDNIPAYVLVLAEDGRITSVNRALRERIPETAIGQDLSVAFPSAPAEVVATIGSLLESTHRERRVHSLHGERLALFGSEGRYSVHAVPLETRFPDAHDILVFDDVSEVHSLASQLVRAEKLSTVGVLAAGIAHEIGTPLGIVRARAELMSTRTEPDHRQTQWARTIVEQIDRVSRTIRQLLDFSRVKPVTVVAVSVAQGARAAVELLRFESERRGVSLEAEAPADLPLVAADPDQLQQVLVNLILNACDACQNGGTVRIAAHHEPQDCSPSSSSYVRIVVSDEGCGVPPELVQQVFDPFFTTKKRGQGTGLGLTIAAQIVRNHGGQIDLASKPGCGTRVIVLWPTASSQAQGIQGNPRSLGETPQCQPSREY
ncbi:MAG: ATP-binding protein [Pseudomonadota bacterium]